MTQNWGEWLVRTSPTCRNLDKLEEWADKKLEKFIKDGCKVLDLENNLTEQCRLVTGWLSHSFAEKDLRSLRTAK